MSLSAGSRDEIFEGVEAEPVDAFATGRDVGTYSVICIWEKLSEVSEMVVRDTIKIGSTLPMRLYRSRRGRVR